MESQCFSTGMFASNMMSPDATSARDAADPRVAAAAPCVAGPADLSNHRRCIAACHSAPHVDAPPRHAPHRRTTTRSSITNSPRRTTARRRRAERGPKGRAHQYGRLAGSATAPWLATARRAATAAVRSRACRMPSRRRGVRSRMGRRRVIVPRLTWVRGRSRSRRSCRSGCTWTVRMFRRPRRRILRRSPRGSG